MWPKRCNDNNEEDKNSPNNTNNSTQPVSLPNKPVLYFVISFLSLWVCLFFFWGGGVVFVRFSFFFVVFLFVFFVFFLFFFLNFSLMGRLCYHY